jgi:hypothetical protein
MRFLFHRVIVAMLAAASLQACAQITNPDILVSGPPKPHAHRERANPVRAGNLQWLWQYAQPQPNGNAVALREDLRFGALIDAAFHQPQAFWGNQAPLANVIPRFLSRYGEVNSKNNRYLTVDGCVPSFCAAHGMLWVDLGAPQPLLVFAAVNWTTENHTTDEANADYNLWLFASRRLSPDDLPVALRESIADWDARLSAAHRGVPHIAHALLVEPDGQPFPLNPALVGANTLPPQADTVTPKPPDS